MAASVGKSLGRSSGFALNLYISDKLYLIPQVPVAGGKKVNPTLILVISPSPLGEGRERFLWPLLDLSLRGRFAPKQSPLEKKPFTTAPLRVAEAADRRDHEQTIKNHDRKMIFL
jgi:hypothetical protein